MIQDDRSEKYNTLAQISCSSPVLDFFLATSPRDHAEILSELAELADSGLIRARHIENSIIVSKDDLLANRLRGLGSIFGRCNKKDVLYAIHEDDLFANSIIETTLKGEKHNIIMNRAYGEL